MIEQLGKNKYKLIVNIQLGEGKRVRRTKTVSCGKREANRLYADFESEVKADFGSTSEKLYEAMKDYIRSCELNGRSANTTRGYNVARERIISFLTDKKCDKVNSLDITKMIAQMQNKPYSPKTIKNTLTFLSQVFEREIKLGRCSKNPCKNVEMPKQKASTIQTIPSADLRRFTDSLDKLDADTKVAIELALFCGLRRSEILGLREENVIGDNLHVIETRHVVNKNTVIQGTKTSRSRRTLAMPKFVVDDVNDLIEKHKSLDFDTSDYLIQDGFGEPLNPSTLSSRVSCFCKSQGLNVSMHKLRHTFASMLINSGKADIIQISAELGHSNTATTLNVYGHLMEDASASSRHISSIIEGINSKENEDTEAKD